MLAHLTAVREHLAPLAYECHLGWAYSPAGQYLVLGGRSVPESSTELPICGTTESLDTEIRVKAVTGTIDGALIMLARIGDRLSPGRRWQQIPMTGRIVHLRFMRSEFTAVDTDATITGTSRHPAYGVDTYRLLSQPA